MFNVPVIQMVKELIELHPSIEARSLRYQFVISLIKFPIEPAEHRSDAELVLTMAVK